MWNGKRLNDESTLAELRIPNGAILTEVVQKIRDYASVNYLAMAEDLERTHAPVVHIWLRMNDELG
jgi:hypothetical protein